MVLFYFFSLYLVLLWLDCFRFLLSFLVKLLLLQRNLLTFAYEYSIILFVNIQYSFQKLYLKTFPKQSFIFYFQFIKAFYSYTLTSKGSYKVEKIFFCVPSGQMLLPYPNLIFFSHPIRKFPVKRCRMFVSATSINRTAKLAPGHPLMLAPNGKNSKLCPLKSIELSTNLSGWNSFGFSQ